jgi:hypothetical protein
VTRHNDWLTRGSGSFHGCFPLHPNLKQLVNIPPNAVCKDQIELRAIPSPAANAVFQELRKSCLLFRR